MSSTPNKKSGVIPEVFELMESSPMRATAASRRVRDIELHIAARYGDPQTGNEQEPLCESSEDANNNDIEILLQALGLERTRDIARALFVENKRLRAQFSELKQLAERRIETASTDSLQCQSCTKRKSLLRNVILHSKDKEITTHDSPAVDTSPNSMPVGHETSTSPSVNNDPGICDKNFEKWYKRRFSSDLSGDQEGLTDEDSVTVGNQKACESGSEIHEPGSSGSALENRLVVHRRRESIDSLLNVSIDSFRAALPIGVSQQSIDHSFDLQQSFLVDDPIIEECSADRTGISENSAVAVAQPTLLLPTLIPTPSPTTSPGTSPTPNISCVAPKPRMSGTRKSNSRSGGLRCTPRGYGRSASDVGSSGSSSSSSSEHTTDPSTARTMELEMERRLVELGEERLQVGELVIYGSETVEAIGCVFF
jgi:hypothetical protein